MRDPEITFINFFNVKLFERLYNKPKKSIPASINLTKCSKPWDIFGEGRYSTDFDTAASSSFCRNFKQLFSYCRSSAGLYKYRKYIRPL